MRQDYLTSPKHHNRRMGAQLASKLTVEEYFAMDDASERPLEYHNGELFPMVAATPQHSVILASVTISLGVRLKGGPCFLAGAPRVQTTASNYVYPDIAVICGGFEYSAESANAITNPTVIVEILSPTTADFDHGGKHPDSGNHTGDSRLRRHSAIWRHD